MSSYKILFFIMGGISFASGVTAIGLLFYIGKTRIKEIDKVVYGYEFPHDSIFALMIRVPSYAGGFMWKWSARRSGLEGKIEHFDARFRWPFIASFVLFLICMISAIVGTLIKNYLGID